MTRPSTADELVWQPLIVRTLARDTDAWRKLQEQCLLPLDRWARRHPGMRRRKLAHSEDDVQEVVLRTLERMRANDFANLSSYLQHRDAAAAANSFEGWLYGAFEFAVREHLRARFGRFSDRARAEHEKGAPLLSKRDINTLAPRYDDEAQAIARTGLTVRITVRELMRHVDEHFSVDEAAAMHMLVDDGASNRQIAERLGLESEEDADRLIRKLKQRLRVHFHERP